MHPGSLSVTKWIHLNEGDDGLRRFFERVHSVLQPGGLFILEPQEWETYAKAKRLDPVRASFTSYLHAFIAHIMTYIYRN